MPIRKLKTRRKISPMKLGEMLQEAWEKGEIGNEVKKCIEAGVIPIQLLRDQLAWVLERGDCGNLFLTTEQELS